ncbi:MAG: response regulator, partial [Desulfobulbaceae bacterium]|nr:response regulator [Desulfobulbaceae bacterium]
FTDMNMPRLTGARLAEAMLALRPELPVILFSGYSESMTKAKALKLGIRAYAMKPLTIIQMATLIRQVLDAEPASLEAPLPSTTGVEDALPSHS